ncbi:MAG: hypothetical protein AMJ92_08090 [candidate division Zixibacteria bacterium SM23_81]|nr:MAG: hypothetical protein AMJ92_08090 [candidate division Zixibacteria bacterium SM23_81]
MKISRLFLLMALVLVLSTSSAYGLQLITNGGFEIGTIAGGDPSFNVYEYWSGMDFVRLETPSRHIFHRNYNISGISGQIADTIEFGATPTGDICYPTSLYADNASVDAVPEPATLLLLGTGLVGLGAVGTARRRKK